MPNWGPASVPTLHGAEPEGALRCVFWGVEEGRWGFSEVVPTLGIGAAGQMCTAGGCPDPALRPPPVAASLNWGGGRAESSHALKHRNGAMEWGWGKGGSFGCQHIKKGKEQEGLKIKRICLIKDRKGGSGFISYKRFEGRAGTASWEAKRSVIVPALTTEKCTPLGYEDPRLTPTQGCWGLWARSIGCCQGGEWGCAFLASTPPSSKDQCNASCTPWS